VGWSTGALLGGLLAGGDPRIKAYVLVGGHNGDVTKWPVAERDAMKAQGMSLKDYAAQLFLVEPALYLRRNKDARFLFMWGKELDVAGPGVQKELLSAAPRAILYMHSGGHFVSPDADRHLVAWISKTL
jgi:hypothetical protein